MYRYFLLAVLTQTAIASYSPYIQITLRNKGYSYSLVGVIMALGQAAAIVGPLVLSALTDKKGRTKPFLILCALVSILFGIPYFLSSSTAVVILSVCLLDAFFWSLNPLSDGFLNRALKGRSDRYGLLRACGTFGYMTALVVFALTGFPDEGSNTSIMKCFVLFLGLYTVAAFMQKEEKRETKGDKKKFFSPSWFEGRYYLFMLIVAFTRVGQSVVEKLLASYMTEYLDLGQYFSLFIALGAFFEFFSMIIFGRLLKMDKITPSGMLLLSAVALTVRLLLYLVPNIFVFALAQTLHGLTFGALHVAATTFTARNTSSEHYEVGMSIYWAVATNLPELIGSLCGGFVIDRWGYPVLFASYALFPFIAVVLCMVLRKKIRGRLSDGSLPFEA